MDTGRSAVDAHEVDGDVEAVGHLDAVGRDDAVGRVDVRATAAPAAGSDPSRPPASSTATAIVVLLAASLPAVGALVLWAIDRPGWDLDTWFTAVDVMVALVYGPVAALLLRRTRHPAAWVFAVAAVGGGLAAFGARYLGHSLIADPLPGWETVGSMAGWAWVPGTVALVVVLPWLVRRERLGAGARSMVAVGLVVCAVVWAVRITNPAPWPDGDPFMPLAIRDEWWARASDDVLPWLFLVVVALGAVAAADVTRRQGRPGDPDRRSLRWLAIGSWVMALSFVPLTLPSNWFQGTVAVSASTPVLHLVAQAFLPAAVLVVVLRQRLWGADLVISRALPWGLLTGGLVLLSSLVAAVLGAAVDDDGVQLAVTATMLGLLVVPGHRWLQRRVDLLVYGDASSAIVPVREVGRLIGTADSSDANSLLEDVLVALARSSKLAWARVVPPPDDGHGSPAVDVRAAEDAIERVPLWHGGGTIGYLEVAPHAGERIDARTRRSLRDLAPIVATVVTLTRLNEQLVHARERLTTARLEERRLVRRDLHDGLGPALAGVALGLRASRNLLVTDPARAAQLLDDLAVEVEHRVADVRELSRALLPPVLDELGLLAAVHDLAARVRHDGLRVTVDGGDSVDAVDAGELSNELPAEIATAAFAVVSEATMNARRHADARHVRIAITRPDTGRSLRVVVEDDGQGWRTDHTSGSAGVADTADTAGVGLRSMRERAAALGGTVAFDTGSLGGARVTWHVPTEGAR